MIQNFEFEKNIGQFRPTKHAFKLNFVTSTKVKEQDFPMIPEMVYGFTLFDDVLTGSANPDYLIGMFITYFLFSPLVVMDSKVNKPELMGKCYRGVSWCIAMEPGWKTQKGGPHYEG